MLVIQVLHEDHIAPTKWILLRIWFHLGQNLYKWITLHIDNVFN
jgi:hypothetical protein